MLSRKRLLTGMLMVAALALSAAQVANAETDKQTRERMAKENKDAADRSSQRETEKGGGNYTVKKTHDDHIPQTEKAAAGANTKEKNKDSKDTSKEKSR